MGKKGELIVTAPGFDYASLEQKKAEGLKSAADRIRAKVQRSLESIIEIGADLLAVKDALPHGQFGRWLQLEFGWTERMARNFMGVAEQFGKTEIISDLRIQPTAAYLLSAPSAPEEARHQAIERAEAGEQITTGIAKEILSKARTKQKRRTKTLPAEFLKRRLQKTLTWYKERWNPKDLASLARVLHEFADQLEPPAKMTDKRR